MRKNKAKAILNALKEPAPLSTNKGRILREKYKGLNRKNRRHSGRYTPHIIIEKESYSEMIENAEEPQESYDDWINYRDGSRYDPDLTHLRDEYNMWGDIEEIREANKKVLKKINIRKSKQEKKLNKKNTYGYTEKIKLAKRM